MLFSAVGRLGLVHALHAPDLPVLLGPARPVIVPPFLVPLRAVQERHQHRALCQF